MMNEEFKRISQIAIVVKDIEKARAAWAKILGVKENPIIETEDWEKTKMMFRGKPSEARAKITFFNFENIYIGAYWTYRKSKHMAKIRRWKGGDIYHIAFHVTDLDKALKRFEEAGINVEQKGNYKGGCYIYMDSTAKLGGIIEILHNYK